MKWLKGVSLVLGLLSSVLLIWQAYRWYQFLNTPLLTKEPAQIIELKPGSGMFSLSRQLKKLGLLKHPRYFEWLAKLSGTEQKLQAGEYELSPGIKPLALLNLLSSGKVIQHQLTLIEGWTFQQVLELLNNNSAIEHTLSHLPAEAIKQQLQITESNLEGLFFPSTYYFSKGTTDVVLLQRAYALLQKYLTTEWEHRQAGLPYQTPYQALIAASLIEKEAKLAAERALISGVIVKRLQTDMLLQIDAAVIYGLGKAYTGKLRRSDLQINTTYNTYLHKGLPPTPIAMPSLAALQAALHPIINDNLFYVARGDGGHYFSANLAAHNNAIQQFLLNKNTAKVTVQQYRYSHNLFNINNILLKVCIKPEQF